MFAKKKFIKNILIAFEDSSRNNQKKSLNKFFLISEDAPTSVL